MRDFIDPVETFVALPFVTLALGLVLLFVGWRVSSELAGSLILLFAWLLLSISIYRYISNSSFVLRILWTMLLASALGLALYYLDIKTIRPIPQLGAENHMPTAPIRPVTKAVAETESKAREPVNYGRHPHLPAPKIIVTSSTASWHRREDGAQQFEIAIILKNESDDIAEALIDLTTSLSGGMPAADDPPSRRIGIGPRQFVTLSALPSLDETAMAMFLTKRRELFVHLSATYPDRGGVTVFSYEGAVIPSNKNGPINVLRSEWMAKH
jgi:hypothetical protein